MERGRRGDNSWRRTLPSIYVGNIKMETTKANIDKVFCRYGRVADIFLIDRKGQSSRQFTRFGFARFFSNLEAQAVLDDSHRFICNGNLLVVKRAVMGRGNRSQVNVRPRTRVFPQRLRGARSYSQVVIDGVEQVGGEVPNRGTVDEEGQELWRNSIVGELREVSKLSWIQSQFDKGNEECKVLYLGGLNVLFRFDHNYPVQELNNHFREKLCSWCSRFYVFPEDYACENRLGWLDIKGIPLRCWGERFFVDVGNFVGNFVSMDKKTMNKERIDMGKILVVVKIFSKIPSSGGYVQREGISSKNRFQRNHHGGGVFSNGG